MYRIRKRFTAEAAHQLIGLPSWHKCSRVHGHSYTVEVVLAAEELDKTGFVVDFADLEPFGRYVAEVMDHRHLNDLVPQPTSELLARHFFDWCQTNLRLREGVRVESVTVSETGRTSATYEPGGAR